ncbi:MAG: DUF2095 family protein [Promethearchaeati archaeon]
MNEKAKEDTEYDKVKIKNEDGLNVSYDKNELDQFLPHLMDEIINKEKSIQIDSIDYDFEESKQLEEKNVSCLDNLSNPKAIDFIRRCSSNEEAIEILDYLLERDEITREEYRELKNQIDNGLEKFIKKSGGFKEPGYYIRKYYHNQETNKKRDSQ